MYLEVFYEKIEKSFFLNKNIFVRNFKDYIVNLFFNDCVGFKSEYEVRFSIMILFFFDDFCIMVNVSYYLIFQVLSCCKIFY